MLWLFRSQFLNIIIGRYPCHDGNGSCDQNKKEMGYGAPAILTLGR